MRLGLTRLNTFVDFAYIRGLNYSCLGGIAQHWFPNGSNL